MRDQAQSDGLAPPVRLRLWPGRLDGRSVRLSLPVHFLQEFKYSKEVPAREVPTKDGVIAQPGGLVVLVS